MTVSLLTNVRAVLPDRVSDLATIAIEDGRIVAIDEHQSYAKGLDGRGAFCLPGLIDTHSDAIEKEILPRPGIQLDASFALRSLEARLQGAGITTMCHAISFEDSAVDSRSVELANTLVDVVAERRAGLAPVDHRILYRVPARSRDGVDAAVAKLSVGQAPGELPILGFEDHSPGQGPFRDLDRYKQYLARAHSLQAEDLDRYVAEELTKAEALLPLRDQNLARVAELAVSGAARVLVHDCDDVLDMESAHAWGAAVAEFPLSVAAARAARDHEMPVVAGAPNVLRGGSHSGYVNAEHLIKLDLCTSLASDYLPSSLLAAAFLLAERRVSTLARAVRLVSAGAAKVLGLEDRGRVEVGARADLLLVTLDARWPRVLASLRAGSGGLGDTTSTPAFAVPVLG